jgi:hypothetical protein
VATSSFECHPDWNQRETNDEKRRQDHVGEYADVRTWVEKIHENQKGNIYRCKRGNGRADIADGVAIKSRRPHYPGFIRHS